MEEGKKQPQMAMWGMISNGKYIGILGGEFEAKICKNDNSIHQGKWDVQTQTGGNDYAGANWNKDCARGIEPKRNGIVKI